MLVVFVRPQGAQQGKGSAWESAEDGAPCRRGQNFPPPAHFPIQIERAAGESLLRQLGG